MRSLEEFSEQKGNYSLGLRAAMNSIKYYVKCLRLKEVDKPKGSANF